MWVVVEVVPTGTEKAMPLLCQSCDSERETSVAYCPMCGEVTDSYEFDDYEGSDEQREDIEMLVSRGTIWDDAGLRNRALWGM